MDTCTICSNRPGAPPDQVGRFFCRVQAIDVGVPLFNNSLTALYIKFI